MCPCYLSAPAIKLTVALKVFHFLSLKAPNHAVGEKDPADKRNACSDGFRDRRGRNPGHENRDSQDASKSLGKKTEEGKLHTTYLASELLKHKAGEEKQAAEVAASRPWQYWTSDHSAD